MAASISVSVVDAAPGNLLEIDGSGLVPGAGANVTLSNQGVTAQPNLTPSTINLTATFASDGSKVTITIPDGVMNGTLTITAGDGSVVTCALRAVSQYVQATEYQNSGEGEPTSGLAAGELDTLLRRASSLCDEFMMGGVRYLQVLERHRYKDRANGAPLLFPFRTSGRPMPTASIDQLTFVSAQGLVTTFNVDDFYVNPDTNYIEILAYAVGNYALLAHLQLIGYSANVIELTFTSGFKVAEYPEAIRSATIITTTMLLNRRRRQSMGLGPFAEYTGTADSRLKLDPSSVVLPSDAKLLLAKYRTHRLA